MTVFYAYSTKYFCINYVKCYICEKSKNRPPICEDCVFSYVQQFDKIMTIK